MSERHIVRVRTEWDPNGGWYDVRDEWHTFVVSQECDHDGLTGHVSMRCQYRYRGCDDRACVCRCHWRP